MKTLKAIFQGRDVRRTHVDPAIFSFSDLTQTFVNMFPDLCVEP